METERVRGFVAHGVRFKGERGSQVFADCPFCGGHDKFHVNRDNMLWDCKKCGKSGNFQQFLEEIVKQNVADCDEDFLNRLAVDRKLPPSAFLPWEVGRSGMAYTFPVRDDRGRLQDVRMYKFGAKVRGTATCHTGLFGAHLIRKTPETSPIYLCEGEWDAIAMSWLLRHLKHPGLVLAVPGATIMKKEWIHYFENRNVNVLYDNDEAGEQGEIAIKEKLAGTAKAIRYLHWSNKMPAGFDIRDLIAQEAIKRKRPRTTYEAIRKMLADEPRKAPAIKATESAKEDEASDIPEKKTIEQVYAAFRKYLFLKNNEAIDVMLAVALSNKLEGDPLWVFLVAPPGGAKTEILSGLSISPEVYFTSSLTPHALISGAPWTSGGDPSLIPKLNGKILVIKDFTSILCKRDVEKDEIFGILRDAYDGTCAKVFGTGVRRTYQSRFTILSAVTPAIYNIGQEHASLGERFLKFAIGSNLQHLSEEDIIFRAINNLNKEVNMRNEIAQTVRGFLYHQFKQFDQDQIPFLPGNIKMQLVALAQFAARTRGTTSRDKYRPEMVTARPSAELGSRLGKQFAKMAISLAMVRGKKMVTQEEYGLCKKTALDTISQRNEDIIRCLFKESPKRGGSIRTRELSALTTYPHATVSRVMADMQMLEIVTRTGKSNKYEWRLSDYIMDLITKADLYRVQEELNRVKIEPQKVVFRKQL